MTTRTTRPAGRGVRPVATTTKPLRSSYGASDGMRQMQEEARKAEARRESNKQRANEPRRYWMKPGETREVVVIDDCMSFFRHEHALKNPASQRFDLFTPCVNEHANCPICKVSDNKPAYFAAYLTILDLTPFEKDDGTVIEWTKRLLVIKPAQQKKYMRLQEREGSLRGMVLELTRDGDKDAAIGNEVEFIEFLDEDTLLDYETVYEDKDGKEHDVIGHEPFDYEEAFPEWTEKQLIAVAGGRAGAGNRDSDDRALGRGRGRGKDDDAEEPPRRASSRRAPRDEEPAEEPPRRAGARRAPRDEEPAEEPPRRAGSRAAAPAGRAAPSRTTSRRPVDDAEEPDVDPEDLPWDGEEEEAVEEPPRRGAGRNAPARTTRDAPTTRGTRRGRDEEEPAYEEQAEPEDAPQRGRGGRTPAPAANRRDQLRNRGR